MRRKDREIVDEKIIRSILDEGKFCNIAQNTEDGYPHIIPLSYAYELNDGKLKLYFHSARAGRKIELMNRDNKVSFCIAIQDELYKAEMACNYSTYYRSVVGFGKLVEVEENKEEALAKIMKQYDKDAPIIFSEGAMKAIALLVLEVEQFSAKGKLQER